MDKCTKVRVGGFCCCCCVGGGGECVGVNVEWGMGGIWVDYGEYVLDVFGALYVHTQIMNAAPHTLYTIHHAHTHTLHTLSIYIHTQYAPYTHTAMWQGVPVAVKVVCDDHAGQQEQQRIEAGDLQLATSIIHPNVVPTYRVWVQRNTPPSRNTSPPLGVSSPPVCGSPPFGASPPPVCGSPVLLQQQQGQGDEEEGQHTPPLGALLLLLLLCDCCCVIAVVVFRCCYMIVVV